MIKTSAFDEAYMMWTQQLIKQLMCSILFMIFGWKKEKKRFKNPSKYVQRNDQI